MSDDLKLNSESRTCPACNGWWMPIWVCVKPAAICPYCGEPETKKVLA